MKLITTVIRPERLPDVKAALFRAGRDWVGGGTSAFRTAAQHYIEQQIALQASGVRTTSRYSRGFLRTLGRHGLRGVAPADLLIR